MFKRKTRPVEERIQRVATATGRAPDEEREPDDAPQPSLYRSAGPGPLPVRTLVAPEPEPEMIAPGRDAPASEHVSALRQNVLRRADDYPDPGERRGLGGRLRRDWLRDRPDPLLFGAVVVIAVVIGLVLLPVLFHGDGKKTNGSVAENPQPTAIAPTTAAQPSVAPTVRVAATPRAVGAPSFALAETPAPTVAATIAASAPPVVSRSAVASQPGQPAAAPTQQPAAVAVTPPVTRPARASAFAPPGANTFAPTGDSLTNVVSSAASQPAPIQVGSSAPGVNPAIAGPANAARASSGGGVAPVSSAGGSAPVVSAAPAQPPPPTTIAPALNNIAAQTHAAAAAASQAGQPSGGR